MVNTTYTKDCPEKLSQIIEAAQRRFGLYGFEKTAMHEIASDLNMSKGSLYYYFPDKEHLYAAVVQKEHDLFLHLVEAKMVSLTDAADMLREYVNIRLSYYRALLNLSHFRHNNIGEMHKVMHSVMQGKSTLFKTQEKELLSKIFTCGIEQQCFENQTLEEMDETSELLLDIIKGLTGVAIKNKDIFYLDDKEYEKTLKRINRFVEMFIKALKK